MLLALRAMLAPEQVLEDVPAGLLDDPTGLYTGSAALAVRPRTTREIADVVALARRHHTALVPRGGGTGLVGGSVAVAGEVVLDLSSLTSPLDVDPVERTVTAGAGVTIAAVQEAAARQGLWLPLDLGSWQSATVGGVVATNAGGTRVLRHGHVRELLLGVEAILGTGEIVSRLRGGRKDNNGYSFGALLCGSEGTLGVITAATLRLVPRPCDAHLIAVHLPSWPEVSAACLVARDLPGVQAVELVGAAALDAVLALPGVRRPFPLPGHVLLIELDDVTHAADALAAWDVAIATSRAEKAQLWSLRHGIAEAARRTGPVHKLDLWLPVRSLATFLDSLDALVRALRPGASALTFGHLVDGNVHVNLVRAAADDLALLDAVVGLALEHGGHASAEHGIGVAKNRWLTQTRSPGDLAAMHALRQALDPDSVLSPRVLVPQRSAHKHRGR